MQFHDVTPNLIVSDVAASLAFYRDVLGFTVVATVPDHEAPYAFAWMQRDEVNVFLNSREAVGRENASLAGRPTGGSFTMFITLTGVDALYESLAGRVRLTMPIETKFYGMREFGIADLDGYEITFAEQVETGAATGA